jgi:hypothetical protein
MSGSVSPTKAVLSGCWPLTVDRVEQDALGQAHVAGVEEQVLGQDLAAGDARHVGNDALHFVDAVLGEKLAQTVG